MPTVANWSFHGSSWARVAASPERCWSSLFRRARSWRNRLLQQRSGDAATRAQLEPWNDQFATVGMDLVNRRRRAVAALQTELARVYGALCAARSKVEIRYRTALGEA